MSRIKLHTEYQGGLLAKDGNTLISLFDSWEVFSLQKYCTWVHSCHLVVTWNK